MIRSCELETCGTTFQAKRSDARYCSASCRAAASRLRRAALKPAAPTKPPPSTSVPSQSPAAITAPTPPTRWTAQPDEAAHLTLQSEIKTLGERLTRLERIHHQDQSTLRLLMGDMEEAEQRLQALSENLKRQGARNMDGDQQTQIARLEKTLRRVQRGLQVQEARVCAIDQAAAQALNLLSSML